jgi:transcriptional regulator with XRE-family HTH domain
MPTLDEERNLVNSEFDSIVGHNIRCRRMYLGITQVALAERADMDVSKLSRIENGRRTLTFREGMAVCKVLRLSATSLTSSNYGW